MTSPSAAADDTNKALATTVSDPESMRQQAIARIGKAACMAETGKVDEALSELDDIIGNGDSLETITGFGAVRLEF